MKRDPQITIAAAGAVCGTLACGVMALNLPDANLAPGCLFGLVMGGLVGFAAGAVIKRLWG
jgi:hypothetical protein